MARNANLPCSCGSGKQYKRCCRDKANGISSLYEKMQAGEMNLFARMSSVGGAESKAVISNASITRNGKREVVFEGEIAISANNVTGSKTDDATAYISFPPHTASKGSIVTVGNASVESFSRPVHISLRDGRKKIKAISQSGLYAVARVAMQRDSGKFYFDLLFGTSGQTEDYNEEGVKQRPHVAFYPDGNGKFMRLDGHLCELESQLTFHPDINQVVPEVLKIKSLLHNEIIKITFTNGAEGSIVLDDISFENCSKT